LELPENEMSAVEFDSKQFWGILHSLFKSKKDEANGSDVRQKINGLMFPSKINGLRKFLGFTFGLVPPAS
jgi:hypothetical protein